MNIKYIIQMRIKIKFVKKKWQGGFKNKKRREWLLQKNCYKREYSS